MRPINANGLEIDLLVVLASLGNKESTTTTRRITWCSSRRRMWPTQFHFLSLPRIMTSRVGEANGFMRDVFTASWDPLSACLEQPGGLWAAREVHIPEQEYLALWLHVLSPGRSILVQ